MNEAIIIFGMALVTILVRYPMLALVGRIALPDRVFRALRYVPPAVLTAIIVPAVLFKDEELAVSISNDYLIAAIVSVLVAWRTRNLLLTIVLGMIALLLWRLLLSTHIWGI